ncbi:FAD-binding and (Fe-S)-binding domain-containing protein [Acidocella sp. MX-AZ02]|uniref:FAD-binding and (Fe-S)-binding domain-containing protein n=1 Tax=Acidocella sp. MX-AZ02 TaxID=1214225 RepID=UPI00028DA83B|nr:FAD-binding and (Fe-S)-binding domain-containing protein [Acidocella sp. MX-AZ02]EKM98519.1 FAD linked oxidase [Acidocella sp. MX-AZ02]
MDGMGVEMDQVTRFASALRQAGFGGEVETEAALRVAMSTDNSVYQIMPDVIVAPRDAADMARLASVLDQPAFHSLGVTARGGGTGTNGQSLNRGVIVDTRRHMNRVLAVDAQEGWADVEPGVVLDALNDALRPSGWFFAPETSTSTRCTIGGMVSTDASGKGSRVYGKTSDNIIGLELARPEGLLSSLAAPPDWATGMLARAEAAARAGRAAFIAHTPRLNRRFTGYDLERACPEAGGFEWWRLFLGAEGTLGLISRIRVKLRRIEPEKRLLVVGFAQFRQALAAAGALMAFAPTAIEVMDERVQALAGEAGILARLPPALRAGAWQRLAYVFIEFNGTDGPALEARLAACLACLEGLEGARAVHMAQGLAEIKALWAIRSAGVGLLGKIQGVARPVAFVEDCVVPPENLPAFLDEFLAVLEGHGLEFGIYGHVDVGCLHVRPALNIDSAEDRQKLGAVSDAVFALTRKYGGVFWGEHGKGVRGAYLRAWIGEEAYAALRQVKAAFDPQGRFNPGKLVTGDEGALGILTTPFRPFNAPEGDALAGAFRCNGNAQCLSYEASTPMCPSYKATADLRQSPKGRADALRDWHRQRQSGPADPALEAGLLATLDGCLGCKACASTCPVQVDVPGLRSAFYADYYARHARPLADRLALLGERLSPASAACAPVLRPLWPVLGKLGGVLGMLDLPRHYAPKPPRRYRLDKLPQDATALGARPVVLVQDWFSALFDGAAQRDAIAGLEALGYRPWLLKLHPAGKVAQTFGALPAFMAMATRLCAALAALARLGVPLVGLDPALVMQLRQDYPKAGLIPPSVALPQEFLVRELEAGRVFPQAAGSAPMRLFSHCTESTAVPAAGALWRRVYEALGLEVETPSTGCCGMAGLFGHQERHQRVSRRLFDLSWRAKLEGEAEMAASGFSCRCQAERLAGKQLRHPLGLIAQALAGKTP